MSIDHDDYHDHVRLNEQERDKVLGRMDDVADTEATFRADMENKREDRRWPYRIPNIPLTAEHPGGGVSRLMVATRNLSSGGISFLHGGFMYEGTECKLLMTRLDEITVPISGRVVSCRLVDGTLHEIGVKFDRRIDPRSYFRGAECEGGGADSDVLPDMGGCMLYVESSTADQQLLEQHLKPTSIELMMSSSSAEAIKLMKEHTFDIVLCNLNIEGESGIDAIKSIRGEGFGGPIILITKETDGRQIAEARNAGALQTFTKPIDTKILFPLLTELHQNGEDSIKGDLIYSSLENKPAMIEMITEYIEQTTNQAQMLDIALSDDQFKEVREICLAIKGSAEGYGFLSLNNTANEALRSIEASGSLQEAKPHIRRLLLTCSRLSIRNTESSVAEAA